MRPERAWVRLESGRRFNLLQPDPVSWTDRDLAIGLSRTYRWGGHSCWDLPLSVAQHSRLVLVPRQKIAPLDRLTRGEALRELLHDAGGMLSFDPISRLKPHLGTDYDNLDSKPLEYPAGLDACMAREKTVAELATVFSRLPHCRRLRCGRPPTGNSLTDTFVLVEVWNNSASIEGVIVDSERDEEGALYFDAPFTELTTDEELIGCHGDCYVDVQ
jgi:hypothetical protein